MQRTGCTTRSGMIYATTRYLGNVPYLITMDIITSWVQTPDAIRERGGALFCDRRYDHVFVYHNGAESYFGGRGFRGSLRV